MSKDKLLNEIVEMLSAVSQTNLSEMTAVIRRAVKLYYVQPKHLSNKKVSKIYDIINKNYREGAYPKNDNEARRYLHGRVFARQIVLPDSDKLKFEFYVTKNKFSDWQDRVTKANVKEKDKLPEFLASDNATLIDDDIISIRSDIVPGDTVRMLRTGGRSDSVEREFLEHFQRELAEAGLGSKTNTVVISGKKFENVAGMIKKPGAVNAADADFVLVDDDGTPIEGSSISHKAEIFRSYGGVKKLLSNEKIGKFLNSFVSDCEAAWKKWIKAGKSASAGGFKRKLPDDITREVLYKGGINFVVIGNLQFKYVEQGNYIAMSGKGLYERPTIPNEAYRPVLRSIYGSGGSKVDIKLDMTLYLDLNEMDDIGLLSGAIEKRLAALKLIPMRDSLPGLPEVGQDEGVIVGARLPIRLECVPQNKASGARLTEI